MPSLSEVLDLYIKNPLQDIAATITFQHVWLAIAVITVVQLMLINHHLRAIRRNQQGWAQVSDRLQKMPTLSTTPGLLARMAAQSPMTRARMHPSVLAQTASGRRENPFGP